MRRTFVSFNKDGRAEDRLDGFYPALQVPKDEFMARRLELVEGEENVFLVDEDLVLNHLLASSSLKYDGKTDALQGASAVTAQPNGGVLLSLDLLRDDFGGRQTKEPCYSDWDSKVLAFRGE
ncbi:hypothetical protein DQ04_01661020 [Trypanosoma grayi]|uniref:hypothetical protein n=1 Tax=Trypanosoma grayi TaxID=71804 RepID=UPI0004F488AD|nr:hypothetical protein DQ04_01661020 [Trypanosoma grayi]KEG12498.1 hypothetical protein DQ04_01661020 [Trypanosoma grayi]